MSGRDFSALDPLPMPFQASDLLYVSRGGQSYQATPDPSILGPNSGGLIRWAHFQIRKPAGQSGGAFSPHNTWIERPFNYANPANEFGSLSPFPTPGRITLLEGVYAVTGWLTGMENGGMRVRLMASDASLSPIYSASVYSRHYSWHIPLEGLLVVTQTTEFTVQMRCDRNRSKSWGFGYRTFIDPEIYGSLLFFKKS